MNKRITVLCGDAHGLRGDFRADAVAAQNGNLLIHCLPPALRSSSDRRRG